MQKHPRVAIVYDRVNKFGGAERVLLALKQLYPRSVLFTSVFAREAADWVGDWEVRTSFLQSFTVARRHHEWLAPLMPLAFETLDFSGFDLIISVTSEFAKNILTTPDQLHVCYCLTPTRYLWSHTREYGGGRLSWLKRYFFSGLRRIDFQAAQRPQAFIAISRRVKNRIALYYRRESRVIFPPTTLSGSSVRISDDVKKKKYFLVVSRLVPYKRIDLAIEASRKLNRHLHIVGTGSDGLRLLALAGNSPYIHFEGNVDDRRLTQLYQGAQALICPQEEDFGLVSLEAQGIGVPVISYKHSGIAETLLDGQTGILFTDQTTASLCGAIKACEKRHWNRSLVRKQMKKYSEEKFRLAFRREIARLWQKRQDAVQ